MLENLGFLCERTLIPPPPNLHKKFENVRNWVFKTSASNLDAGKVT